MGPGGGPHHEPARHDGLVLVGRVPLLGHARHRGSDGIIPPGEPQTGNAAAFKEQALRWTTETGFAPRRSVGDWYASTDSRLCLRRVQVEPGPLRLKAGATRTERFAWYPYDSFDGEVWLQPLPPGPVTVTASWPYLGRGERPSMSSRRAYRTMKPVKATTELEVTGDGPGTPSLPELIDIALADPEFRAWVDLEPGRERWCRWCVSVTGWPGPTYEHHLYLSHLGDTRPNGVLTIELDQRKTRGIISLDPWTGEVIDVQFLGGPGEGLDAFDVLADPQAQADRSALPASPSPGSTAATFDIFAESPTTTVSLGLYSGLPDPSWELSEEESAALTALLESLPRVDGSPPSGGLGYHGFAIERLTPEGMPRLLVAFEGTVSDPASSHLSYLDDPDRSVERFLLESGRDQLSAVEIMAPGLDPGPMPSPGSSVGDASRAGPATPDARAAALTADDGLATPAVERDAAAGADASGGPAADGGAVGLAPDQGATTAGSGLELDAALAALAGWDDQRPKLRRAHPRQGLEVIHHDHHPIGRPGFRINTA